MDFLVLGALFLVAYLLNRYILNYWSRRGFYQLQPSFLIGDIGSVARGKESIGECFQSIYNKHKSQRILGMYVFYKPVLLVIDPLLIQDILVRDFTSFHDRGMYADEEREPLTAHLFILSGQKWRDLRVKLSPTFTSGKLKGMFPMIRDCAKVMEDYLSRNVKTGEFKIDAKDFFARLTTNIISSVAFGIENDSINDPDNHFRKMGAKMMDPGLKAGLRTFITLMLPNIKKYTLYLPYFRMEQEVVDFIFTIVNQTIEYREKNNVVRNDFMQLMLQLKNQGYLSVDQGSKYDEKTSSDLKKLTINQVAAQAFVFFIGGFETSSSTMFYCMFELAKNPEIQQKVQQEIDEVFEKAGPDGLTYELMGDLKYLECCIDETLRKYPLGSILIREATTDYKINGSDLVIPKGTSLFIPTLGHHRDPDIYENPMQFMPERFLNSSTGGGKSNGLFYLPFGDGPRNCIGMRMGKVTSKIGLVYMLSKFKVALSDKTMADKEIKFDPTRFGLNPTKAHYFNISSR